MTTLFLTSAAKKFVSPKVIDFTGGKLHVSLQTPEDPVRSDIDEHEKFDDVADMRVDDTQNYVAEKDSADGDEDDDKDDDSADDDDGNSSQFSKFYY